MLYFWKCIIFATMKKIIRYTELYFDDAQRLALYLSQREQKEIEMYNGLSEFFPLPPKGVKLPERINAFSIGDYRVAYIFDGAPEGKDMKYHNRNLHRVMLGERITEARESKGMSLESLELLTGIKASNIANIELGRLDAGIDVISNIGEALGCHIDFIFD